MMGDKFNLTGDFRGANINIKSKLQNVQQVVGELHTSDEDARQELHDLIEKLAKELEKAPPERREDAEAVVETAQILVEQAKSEKPNKRLLKISGDGLKEAAKSLGEYLPGVISITMQIVMTVAKLH